MTAFVKLNSFWQVENIWHVNRRRLMGPLLFRHPSTFHVSVIEQCRAWFQRITHKQTNTTTRSATAGIFPWNIQEKQDIPRRQMTAAIDSCMDISIPEKSRLKKTGLYCPTWALEQSLRLCIEMKYPRYIACWVMYWKIETSVNRHSALRWRRYSDVVVRWNANMFQSLSEKLRQPRKMRICGALALCAPRFIHDRSH